MKSEMHWGGDTTGTPTMVLEGETFRTATIQELNNVGYGSNLRFRAELKDGRGVHPHPEDPLDTMASWDVRCPTLAEAIIVGRAWVEGE